VKAIEIDLQNKTVKEVSIYGDRTSICDILQSDDYVIGTYDTNNFDTLYVDPVAQSHSDGPLFEWKGKRFHGNGVIIGTTMEGEHSTVETKLSNVKVNFIAQ
jgi:hypothetical protein